MTDNSNPQGRVQVDSHNFLTVDGIKVCKVTTDGKLQFCDKDARRSSERGTRYVTVDMQTIVNTVKPPPKSNGEISPKSE